MAVIIKNDHSFENSAEKETASICACLLLCIFLHIQVADFNVYRDQIHICWNILDISYIEDFIFKLIIPI